MMTLLKVCGRQAEEVSLETVGDITAAEAVTSGRTLLGTGVSAADVTQSDRWLCKQEENEVVMKKRRPLCRVYVPDQLFSLMFH